MSANPLAVSGQVVADLRHMLRSGTSNLSAVPSLVVEVITNDLWRERVEPKTGEVVRFRSFTEFVTTPPLAGLGADVATLERICHEDADALRLLHEVTAQPDGVHAPSIISGTATDRQHGTTRAYTITRLATERPDLYERVKAGGLSANAAAIEAGFRRPSMTVPTDVPGLVRALRRRLAADDLAALIVALGEQGCELGSSSQATSNPKS